MTTNWTEVFDTCTSEELDKLAVLRIVECTNGILQYMFRDKADDALTVEETREAMGFSMSSIKRMRIVLENEVIEFSDDTKRIMGDVRDLYLRGMKRGDDEAYAEFLVASLACLKACGLDRLEAAKDKLFANCYAMPAYSWQYGMDYCRNFIVNG